MTSTFGTLGKATSGARSRAITHSMLHTTSMCGHSLKHTAARRCEQLASSRQSRALCVARCTRCKQCGENLQPYQQLAHANEVGAALEAAEEAVQLRQCLLCRGTAPLRLAQAWGTCAWRTSTMCRACCRLTSCAILSTKLASSHLLTGSPCASLLIVNDWVAKR